MKADVVYDVLLDSDYRKKWDSLVHSIETIGYITASSDVCYVASMLCQILIVLASSISG